MFKTDDGRLFASLNEAVIHEQQTFVSTGLTPLLTSLLSLPPRDPNAPMQVPCEAEVTLIVSNAVANLVANRPMLQEFQKLFAKLQLAPTNAVAKKRARPEKKKAPAAPQAPAPEAPLPEAPKAAVPSPDSPPFVTAAGAPTEEYLAELDGLAGDPIVIPTDDEQAPPPPQA
jgi:hypothetical protein